MAGASLLTLLDDITTVLDDVAAMTKVAAQKTAGVLGDDLALNAQQVTGVRAERELPVVWAVAKGSLLNKLILVPAALALSVFLPWMITPLLIAGGLFLCFEGAEKVLHKFFHHEDDSEEKEDLSTVDPVAYEKNKIRGAIRTDFILSAEIIVIALGTVADQSFGIQSAVVSAIAFTMTIGVYGLVAGIVKIDDAGLHLMQTNEKGSGTYRFGEILLNSCPYLMKTLSFLGTVAMFLVGGGILLHGIEPLHHVVHHLVHATHLPHVLELITEQLAILITGFIAGLIIVGIISMINKTGIKNQPK